MTRDPPPAEAPARRRTEWPSRMSSLEDLKAQIRSFLAEVCNVSVEAEESQAFLLAAVEAAANVIRHAHGQDGRPFRADLVWTSKRREIQLVLWDTGPPFQPPPPTDDIPDLLAESGRGWWLMRTLTDGVEYRPARDGNRENLTILRKRLFSPTGETASDPSDKEE